MQFNTYGRNLVDVIADSPDLGNRYAHLPQHIGQTQLIAAAVPDDLAPPALHDFNADRVVMVPHQQIGFDQSIVFGHPRLPVSINLPAHGLWIILPEAQALLDLFVYTLPVTVKAGGKSAGT